MEDAQWQEMGNGAFRLTARVNGVEYHATISPKSPTGKRIAECGGIKMDEESLRQFVKDLLLPKSRELTQIIHRVNSNDESS